MIYLTILTMLVYGLLAILNVRIGSMCTTRTLRWIVAFLFFILAMEAAWPFETLNHYLLALMMIAVIGSGEIGKFKIAKGDQSRVFLVHAFTLMLMVGFVVLLFVV